MVMQFNLINSHGDSTGCNQTKHFSKECITAKLSDYSDNSLIIKNKNKKENKKELNMNIKKYSIVLNLRLSGGEEDLNPEIDEEEKKENKVDENLQSDKQSEQSPAPPDLKTKKIKVPEAAQAVLKTPSMEDIDKRIGKLVLDGIKNRLKLGDYSSALVSNLLISLLKSGQDVLNKNETLALSQCYNYDTGSFQSSSPLDTVEHNSSVSVIAHNVLLRWGMDAANIKEVSFKRLAKSSSHARVLMNVIVGHKDIICSKIALLPLLSLDQHSRAYYTKTERSHYTRRPAHGITTINERHCPYSTLDMCELELALFDPKNATFTDLFNKTKEQLRAARANPADAHRAAKTDKYNLTIMLAQFIVTRLSVDRRIGVCFTIETICHILKGRLGDTYYDPTCKIVCCNTLYTSEIIKAKDDDEAEDMALRYLGEDAYLEWSGHGTAMELASGNTSIPRKCLSPWDNWGLYRLSSNFEFDKRVKVICKDMISSYSIEQELPDSRSFVSEARCLGDVFNDLDAMLVASCSNTEVLPSLNHRGCCERDDFLYLILPNYASQKFSDNVLMHWGLHVNRSKVKGDPPRFFEVSLIDLVHYLRYGGLPSSPNAFIKMSSGNGLTYTYNGYFYESDIFRAMTWIGLSSVLYSTGHQSERCTNFGFKSDKVIMGYAPVAVRIADTLQYIRCFNEKRETILPDWESLQYQGIQWAVHMSAVADLVHQSFIGHWYNTRFMSEPCNRAYMSDLINCSFYTYMNTIKTCGYHSVLGVYYPISHPDPISLDKYWTDKCYHPKYGLVVRGNKNVLFKSLSKHPRPDDKVEKMPLESECRRSVNLVIDFFPDDRSEIQNRLLEEKFYNCINKYSHVLGYSDEDKNIFSFNRGGRYPWHLVEPLPNALKYGPIALEIKNKLVNLEESEWERGVYGPISIDDEAITMLKDYATALLIAAAWHQNILVQWSGYKEVNDKKISKKRQAKMLRQIRSRSLSKKTVTELIPIKSVDGDEILNIDKLVRMDGNAASDIEKVISMRCLQAYYRSQTNDVKSKLNILEWYILWGNKEWKHFIALVHYRLVDVALMKREQEVRASEKLDEDKDKVENPKDVSFESIASMNNTKILIPSVKVDVVQSLIEHGEWVLDKIRAFKEQYLGVKTVCEEIVYHVCQYLIKYSLPVGFSCTLGIGSWLLSWWVKVKCKEYEKNEDIKRFFSLPRGVSPSNNSFFWQVELLLALAVVAFPCLSHGTGKKYIRLRKEFVSSNMHKIEYTEKMGAATQAKINLHKSTRNEAEVKYCHGIMTESEIDTSIRDLKKDLDNKGVNYKKYLSDEQNTFHDKIKGNKPVDKGPALVKEDTLYNIDSDNSQNVFGDGPYNDDVYTSEEGSCDSEDESNGIRPAALTKEMKREDLIKNSKGISPSEPMSKLRSRKLFEGVEPYQITNLSNWGGTRYHYINGYKEFDMSKEKCLDPDKSGKVWLIMQRADWPAALDIRYESGIVKPMTRIDYTHMFQKHVEALGYHNRMKYCPNFHNILECMWSVILGDDDPQVSQRPRIVQKTGTIRLKMARQGHEMWALKVLMTHGCCKYRFVLSKEYFSSKLDTFAVDLVDATEKSVVLTIERADVGDRDKDEDTAGDNNAAYGYGSTFDRIHEQIEFLGVRKRAADDLTALNEAASDQ